MNVILFNLSKSVITNQLDMLQIRAELLEIRTIITAMIAEGLKFMGEPDLKDKIRDMYIKYLEIRERVNNLIELELDLIEKIEKGELSPFEFENKLPETNKLFRDIQKFSTELYKIENNIVAEYLKRVLELPE